MTARPRPTYANTMSTIAVVIALTTGSAYAAGLGKNSVKAKHIASNVIKARHIASGAVQSDDVKTGAIGSRALQNGAVGADDLGDNSVGSSELAGGSVGSGELATGSVGSSELAAGSVGTGELANSSVTDAKIATNGVGTSEIKDESVQGEDIAQGTISSARLTSGVYKLLFDAGTMPFNDTYGDVTVSSHTWPAGAPNSGAQLNATWSQEPNTLDIVSGTARVSYEASCANTNSTARGLDVKIVDGSGRVISASSNERTDGVTYNGNGFWAEQAALPGVPFRAPLVGAPDATVDYIHLPFEMAEFVTGGSSASRTVRVYFKGNSENNCDPVVTDARIYVLRYANRP